MASADVGNGEMVGGSGLAHVIQVNNSEVADEISPLLLEAGDRHPRMNIFSVSYNRKRPPKIKAILSLPSPL
ncbi:hypothetical protein KSP39_PZI015565 [Platanthera zijinensis]|uniref:Uncharacterized protein n=1 Tax=Platanthera zijinensis TaxID=2320716 RepID=A0AAP0B8W4_9ASPA